MNVSIHPAAVERAMSAAQQLLASLGEDADEEAVLLSLESETDALEIARKIIRMALDAEAMEKAAKRRVDDLINRADRFAARAQSARETVKQMLDALGVNRLQAEDFTVSLRMGPPKAIVPEPEKLPEEFWRVSRAPNLTAIGKALAEGVNVPGTAKSNGSLILQVKTR